MSSGQPSCSIYECPHTLSSIAVFSRAEKTLTELPRTAHVSPRLQSPDSKPPLMISDMLARLYPSIFSALRF